MFRIISVQAKDDEDVLPGDPEDGLMGCDVYDDESGVSGGIKWDAESRQYEVWYEGRIVAMSPPMWNLAVTYLRKYM